MSISLIFDISIHGRKNKTCVTKTLFTNFTRRNCFLQVWKNLSIVLKIKSHAKLTGIFVNCDENKNIFACCFPLRLFSRSLLSCSAILAFYICTIQPSATNIGQRSSTVVRSPWSPYLKLPICRLQRADRRLQTADHRLQIVN